MIDNQDPTPKEVIKERDFTITAYVEPGSAYIIHSTNNNSWGLGLLSSTGFTHSSDITFTNSQPFAERGHSMSSLVKLTPQQKKNLPEGTQALIEVGMLNNTLDPTGLSYKWYEFLMDTFKDQLEAWAIERVADLKAEDKEENDCDCDD